MYKQFSAVLPLYITLTLTLPIIHNYTNCIMQMSQNFYFFRILDYVDKLSHKQFSDIRTLYLPVTLTLPIIQYYTTVTYKCVEIFHFSENLTMFTIYQINTVMVILRCMCS